MPFLRVKGHSSSRALPHHQAGSGGHIYQRCPCPIYIPDFCTSGLPSRGTLGWLGQLHSPPQVSPQRQTTRSLGPALLIGRFHVIPSSPPSAGERGARGEGSRLPTRPRQKCFLCSVCPVGDGKQDPYLGFRVVRHPGEARLPLQPLTLAGTMSNKGRGQCLPHMDEGGKIWEL